MADFLIVGIGCSAGGLEPLQQLFSKMPRDGKMAFVIAAHLDPTRESHLTELIGRRTDLDVQQVEDSMKVEPDHVYVIAPDQELTIKSEVLHASKPSAPRGQRHPVDTFFRSLAEAQGERSVAIVLSGTGTNGSQGLRFIKAEGGIVLVQDPASAAFDGMPRSAIGTGVVDLVLAPSAMPEALQNLARQSHLRQPEAVLAEGASEEHLKSLLALLRNKTKQDFSGYKKRTLLRRINRRMGLHQIDDLPSYVQRLWEDDDEAKALAADLTINVTGFFRDPEAWQVLEESIIIPLVRERESESAIRIWVPGCSTGEEAYSVAMLIMEHAEKLKKNFALTLFATDVAQGVLSTARAGMYPASIESDVRADRLDRFFLMEGDHYCVRKSLRETLTFAPQNLLQDPPFSRIDLITCRNLLIYLEPDVQKQVLALFHFALREGGHLFLGPSETVSGQEELYEPVSKKWRIYRRVGPTRHDLVDFPLRKKTQRDLELTTPEAQPPRTDRFHHSSLMDQAILDRYAPASVLIDPRCRIHYLRGPTENYLRPPRGEPSYNLLAMARDGLHGPLRVAVRRALDEKREIAQSARVRRNGDLLPVRLVVAPLHVNHDIEGRLLVSFFDRDSEAGPADALEPGETPPPDGGRLQAELDTTREDLRLTLEQMETANEELQASNEEVRSMNEELQASNEELETSKEELQSLNEELNTVNAQLQAKVIELEERTSDLNNLLNSTDVATLFLGRNLSIRRFTPAMKNLLELMPSDVGRPVSHFAQRFTGGDLVGAARQVMDRLVPSEVEVESEQRRWYIRRMMPYRSSEDRIEGVVVTFTDITERKRWERELEGAKEFAEKIVDTIREPLLVLNDDLRVQTANSAFYETFKVAPGETEGRLIYELGNRQWDIPALRKLLEEVLPHDDQFSDFVVEHTFQGIGRRIMLLNGRRLDHVQQILLAIEDVTERHRAHDELQAAHARISDILESITDAFYAVDADFTLIFVNEQALRLWGRSRKEVLGMRLWDLFPHLDVEASEGYRLHMRVMQERVPIRHEFKSAFFNSWVSASIYPQRDGGLSVYFRDISERKRAEEERELLTRELSHRVKNIIAVVQSLARQTTGDSAEQYRNAFLGRLQALVQAHALLLEGGWQEADLSELVRQAVAAYTVDHPDVVEVTGPAVRVSSRQGLGLALVLHELGTNAAKYGALSQHGGRLRVCWQIQEDGQVRLRWHERQGPKVEPPVRPGFGTRLIEHAGRQELDGTVELEFAPEGVRCEVVFPVEQPG